MGWLVSIVSLLLLFSMAQCQESVEILAFHDSTTTSQNGEPVAVPVGAQHLEDISRSVLKAETWLRDHVLADYPGVNISTVIVGHSVFCNRDEQHNLDLVLPSIKNIHHSLTRWGLQNHIKVTAAFSSDCLDMVSEAYRDDVAERYIKPLVSFLQEMGSPCVVKIKPSPHLGITLSAESIAFLESHLKAMEKLGFLHLQKIKVIIDRQVQGRPSSRKLSVIDLNNRVDPFPPRPTPIAPIHSPPGGSTPAYATGSPLPPLVGVISPPPLSIPSAPSISPAVYSPSPPFPPHLAPMANPASPPPYGPHLPPCTPPPEGHGSVGAPGPAAMHSGLWCVAKPSVPQETLQEALDYACGEGGADCGAIQPDGNCFFPETLVAHASYAFNSYWQKTKENGGTCGFGGTAMLINADPSYNHCRFDLA